MIWLVAGTKDARVIADNLLMKGIDRLLASTATKYGGRLFNDDRIEVIDKKLEYEDMKKLTAEKNIDVIVDVSHPYAVNVSRNVMKAAEDTGIEYFRFERKKLDYKGAKRFSSLDEIVRYIKTAYKNENILSTLGSNSLIDIKSVDEGNNLYIRILPTVSSVEKAENLGFFPGKIIAVQGPFSKNLNKVILEDYKIKALITKESGETGGEAEKIGACIETGTEILVLERPKISYINCFENIEELVNRILNK
ncbi:MAG: precorrin-6A reductase [Fusobacteriales bacterium]|nr:precorrin-6A reductase [Fusobacteriales bacterium]